MPATSPTDKPIIYLRMPNWIGDVSMCLPMLHGLMRTNAQIVMCARPWARDLLSAYDFEGWVDMNGKLFDDLASVKAHRQQHAYPSVVGLIVPDSISSALVFRLGGIPSAGHRDEGRSFLLKWPISKPATPMHAVEFWYSLAYTAAQSWGLVMAPTPDTTLSLRLPDSAYEKCTQVMLEAGLTENNYVLIAPTAKGLHKGKNKVWAQYDALHDALTAQGIKVVMCPPAHEHAIAHAAAPNTPIIPPMPLSAFAVLCQRASLVICNDSGVSHLAAAVQARQLSLFGVSTTLRTRPWSPNAKVLGEVNHWPTLQAVIDRAIELVHINQAKA